MSDTDVIQRAKSNISATSSQIQNEVNRRMEMAKSKLNDSMDQARTRFNDSVDQARMRTYQTMDQGRDLVRQRPLVAVGVAFAVGMVLGVIATIADRD